MIAVNELGQQKCHNKELLTDLVILIAPFAPHIAEELWEALGEQGSVCDAAWPQFDEQYLKENDMQLTISFKYYAINSMSSIIPDIQRMH